ncbi:hypothetical protein AGOR_G00246560 [Albula goreensis]|uniref:Uncharacterized protein n=1 Tax=Albula goreensis TaxID=1534307 RepID=A0A8T3CB31_9TELE|nr:hypothetical protein AGOR_G00246560 [Albula goreensis]
MLVSSRDSRALNQKSAGMSRQIQGTWLLAALLTVVAEMISCDVQRCPQHVTTDKRPCPELEKWNQMMGNIAEGIVTSDDETILIREPDLRTMKRTHYYVCFLTRAFRFYEKVLGSKAGGYKVFFDRVKKSCLPKELPCPELCKTLNRNARKPMKEVDNAGELNSRQLAIFQLRKLWMAEKQLSNVTIWEKAIVELRSFYFYLPHTVVDKECPPTRKERRRMQKADE